jgi:hypothetical protein
MKRKNVWGWLLAASLPVVLAACGDDDPPPKAKITFPETKTRVSESDGTLKSFHPDIGTGLQFGTTTGRQIKFKITFDKPLADKAVIAYKLTGTASNVNPNGTTDAKVNDYSLAESGTGYTLDDDNITVDKGVSEVEIAVNVYEDLELEAAEAMYDEATDSFQETVIFTLKSVVSGPIDFDVSTQPEYTLTIYEDDTFMSLQWDVSGSGGDDLDPGDVDMDLYITSEGEIVNNSVNPGTEFEQMFVPAGFPDAVYDMSYPYYSGTTEVDFYVSFINLGGTVSSAAKPIVGYTGHYTVANVNTYDADQESEEGHENYKGPIQTIQSITKSKLNYPTVTDIVIPASGSRSGNNTFTAIRSSKGALVLKNGISERARQYTFAQAKALAPRR